MGEALRGGGGAFSLRWVSSAELVTPNKKEWYWRNAYAYGNTIESCPWAYL